MISGEKYAKKCLLPAPTNMSAKMVDQWLLWDTS